MITRIVRALVSTRLRALLSLGMVLGIGAVSTMAYWTDANTVTTGGFTIGTIDLTLNDQNSLTWTAMDQSNMQPGSSKAGTLTVKNAGGVNFTYNASIAPTYSQDLNKRGTFRVYAGGSPVNANGVGACSGGTAIGTLEPGLNTTTSASIPTLPGAGTWPTGPYSWIADRSLAAGQSENLCVWVAISPDASASTSINATMTANTTFTATQAN